MSKFLQSKPNSSSSNIPRASSFVKVSSSNKIHITNEDPSISFKPMLESAFFTPEYLEQLIFFQYEHSSEQQHSGFIHEALHSALELGVNEYGDKVTLEVFENVKKQIDKKFKEKNSSITSTNSIKYNQYHLSLFKALVSYGKVSKSVLEDESLQNVINNVQKIEDNINGPQYTAKGKYDANVDVGVLQFDIETQQKKIDELKENKNIAFKRIITSFFKVDNTYNPRVITNASSHSRPKIIIGTTLEDDVSLIGQFKNVEDKCYSDVSKEYKVAFLDEVSRFRLKFKNRNTTADSNYIGDDSDEYSKAIKQKAIFTHRAIIELKQRREESRPYNTTIPISAQVANIADSPKLVELGLSYFLTNKSGLNIPIKRKEYQRVADIIMNDFFEYLAKEKYKNTGSNKVLTEEVRKIVRLCNNDLKLNPDYEAFSEFINSFRSKGSNHRSSNSNNNLVQYIINKSTSLFEKLPKIEQDNPNIEKENELSRSKETLKNLQIDNNRIVFLQKVITKLDNHYKDILHNTDKIVPFDIMHIGSIDPNIIINLFEGYASNLNTKVVCRQNAQGSSTPVLQALFHNMSYDQSMNNDQLFNEVSEEYRSENPEIVADKTAKFSRNRSQTGVFTPKSLTSYNYIERTSDDHSKDNSSAAESPISHNSNSLNSIDLELTSPSNDPFLSDLYTDDSGNVVPNQPTDKNEESSESENSKKLSKEIKELIIRLDIRETKYNSDLADLMIEIDVAKADCDKLKNELHDQQVRIETLDEYPIKLADLLLTEQFNNFYKEKYSSINDRKDEIANDLDELEEESNELLENKVTLESDYTAFSTLYISFKDVLDNFKERDSFEEKIVEEVYAKLKIIEQKFNKEFATENDEFLKPSPQLEGDKSHNTLDNTDINQTISPN